MIKNIFVPIVFLLFGIFVFTGCKKILDVEAAGNDLNPTRVRDFQEMLNSDSLATVETFLLDLMSDDVYVEDNKITTTNNVYHRSYFWKDTIWNPGEEDYLYNSTYRRILQMNVILNRLPSAPQDEFNTEENRMVVESQALINRASYYLQLVNTYGKAYDKATAQKDLGVPLIVVPDANTTKPRASLSEIYTQVVGDLKKAVANPYLQSEGIDIIHPGKAAGYALLSRTYLYMKDYDLALAYADSTLSMQNSLLNYNTTYKHVSTFKDLLDNPEIILARLCFEKAYFDYYKVSFQASPDLLEVYGSKYYFSVVDTRYTQRFSYGSFLVSGSLVTNNSIGVPEVMLTKAECLARKGQYVESGAIIDLIRQNRLPQSALVSRDYNAENTLSYVLDERRRELAYAGGLRWFDLKRLAQEGLTSQLVRKDLSQQNVLATLLPESPRYLMPFSPLVISANPQIIQNERK